MNRHVIDVVTLHERASATPDAVSRPRAVSKVPAPAAVALSPEDRTLRATQLWFARAVTTPESEGDAVSDAEAALRLTAGPSMTAAERLEIYRRGYHARLIECLADDYPVLQGALGAGAFEALCRAYVARHPSDGPSLNFYGRFMPGFLRHGAPDATPSRELASDLAALEWSIVEVIHAPSAEPLTLDALGQVPPDAWPGARLVANTALRLQRFDYPVNAFFQQVRDGGAPVLPAPAPSATVVYRSGPTVWRMDLTEPMFEVLQGLLAGEALATALGRAEAGLAGVDPAEIGQRVTHWFREWVASGLFVRVEV
jgi:hypothetical protein